MIVMLLLVILTISESCDGKDNNYNGLINENMPLNRYYRDVAADNYDNPNDITLACSCPSGYVSDNTDCNDSRADVRSGATDICDLFDNDCDGQLNEQCTAWIIQNQTTVEQMVNSKQA